ncbi:MAG: FAD-dependent oxidoreductase [Betaproteobacteria bacterium]|nr:FAD-dependent oxidoreductase [Betaproteobacteria bacterium]
MKIAVIGAGISGLSAAWLLKQQHEVTLFEAGDYIGGHTHTVDVEVAGARFPVDTGFLVFNHRTYPNLTALFRELKVDTVASDMSFAVSMAEPDLEWAGSSLATLFAQKRNLARPGFWRMLQDTLRFNRETAGALPEVTLGDYLAQQGYSAEFRDWYLLPMAAAIWSCPTQAMLDYPLTTFVRFARNHGLLQVFARPQWQTVKGGGREYVNRIVAELADVRLATPVKSVLRDADGVWLGLPGGDCERFDEVVLACHSDQALALLGTAANKAARRILGAIRYQPNRAVLHTDASLLPRDERVWSAWNYMAGAHSGGQQPVSVSYLINHLQPLPVDTPVIVSLNPHVEPDPAQVIGDWDYDHPLFDQASIGAQAQLDAIQGVERLWFCGAWGGYGFHEDGLASALAVANRLGCSAPWQHATERIESAA